MGQSHTEVQVSAFVLQTSDVCVRERNGGSKRDACYERGEQLQRSLRHACVLAKAICLEVCARSFGGN